MLINGGSPEWEQHGDAWIRDTVEYYGDYNYLRVWPISIDGRIRWIASSHSGPNGDNIHRIHLDTDETAEAVMAELDKRIPVQDLEG